MSTLSPRWLVGLLAALLCGGCCYPVREAVDQTVCNLAAHPVDPEPLPSTPVAPESSSPAPPPSSESKPAASPDSNTQGRAPGMPIFRAQAADEPATAAPRPRFRLEIPPDLPGANAPPIRLPPLEPGTRAERERRINELFPALPAVGPDPQAVPGPNGHPLTLCELQHLALTNSPLIRQAAADVEAARGAAIQAGAYPNPTIGYEADTVGTGGTAGYQGVFFDQTVKTFGKLKLAQAASLMDLRNSEVALKRAKMDLINQVRTNYFSLLVAQENVKVSRALVQVSDEAYELFLAQLRRGGLLAAYEPMQFRVAAFQARSSLVQARDALIGSWKQLAATLGLPGMPLTQVAGRVDMPVPLYRYDAVLAQVLTGHTDVLTAANSEQRARYNLALAQVTPLPDVNWHLVVQKDYTMPPNSIVVTTQVGLPVPLWDQNKGAIIQNQGQLLRAVEEHHRVRADLTGRLAAAFQAYQDARNSLEYYRNNILPDQVRVYRGIRARWQENEVAFTDVVVAQQNLAASVTAYVTALGTMWTSVTNVAGLLQTDDLFQVREQQCVAPVPDLAHLPPLPCCHPCSPLPNPALKDTADGSWPPVVPGEVKTAAAEADKTPATKAADEGTEKDPEFHLTTTPSTERPATSLLPVSNLEPMHRPQGMPETLPTVQLQLLPRETPVEPRTEP